MPFYEFYITLTVLGWAAEKFWGIVAKFPLLPFPGG